MNNESKEQSLQKFVNRTAQSTQTPNNTKPQKHIKKSNSYCGQHIKQDTFLKIRWDKPLDNIVLKSCVADSMYKHIL